MTGRSPCIADLVPGGTVSQRGGPSRSPETGPRPSEARNGPAGPWPHRPVPAPRWPSDQHRRRFLPGPCLPSPQPRHSSRGLRTRDHRGGGVYFRARRGLQQVGLIPPDEPLPCGEPVMASPRPEAATDAGHIRRPAGQGPWPAPHVPVIAEPTFVPTGHLRGLMVPVPRPPPSVLGSRGRVTGPRPPQPRQVETDPRRCQAAGSPLLASSSLNVFPPRAATRRTSRRCLPSAVVRLPICAGCPESIASRYPICRPVSTRPKKSCRVLGGARRGGPRLGERRSGESPSLALGRAESIGAACVARREFHPVLPASGRAWGDGGARCPTTSDFG